MVGEATAAGVSLRILPVFITKGNTMKLLSTSKTLLASVALLALAGGAQADVVQIKTHVANGIVYADAYVAPGVTDGAAALWNVSNLDTNTSFLAYCLQILEGVNEQASQTYTSSTYAASAGVQELYDRYYSTVQVSRAYAVGFQLALWQLIGEVDVSAFTAPQDAIARATVLLDGVTNSTTPYAENVYKFTRWSNDGLQDVLQATPAASEVPEPQTHALMLGGLGLMAMGMVSRRRRSGKNS